MHKAAHTTLLLFAVKVAFGYWKRRCPARVEGRFTPHPGSILFNFCLKPGCSELMPQRLDAVYRLIPFKIATSQLRLPPKLVFPELVACYKSDTHRTIFVLDPNMADITDVEHVQIGRRASWMTKIVWTP